MRHTFFYWWVQEWAFIFHWSILIPNSTIFYLAAPEVLLRQRYDQRSDMWSVGVITFLLLAGDLPFTGRSQRELFQNIVRGESVESSPFSRVQNCDELSTPLIVMSQVNSVSLKIHGTLSLPKPKTCCENFLWPTPRIVSPPKRPCTANGWCNLQIDSNAILYYILANG